MNAMRQIAEGLRYQEPAPPNGWVPSEHAPITDLLVGFSGDDETDRQYAMMVKWWQ